MKLKLLYVTVLLLIISNVYLYSQVKAFEEIEDKAIYSAVNYLDMAGKDMTSLHEDLSSLSEKKAVRRTEEIINNLQTTMTTMSAQGRHCQSYRNFLDDFYVFIDASEDEYLSQDYASYLEVLVRNLQVELTYEAIKENKALDNNLLEAWKRVGQQLEIKVVHPEQGEKHD